MGLPVPTDLMCVCETRPLAVQPHEAGRASSLMPLRCDADYHHLGLTACPSGVMQAQKNQKLTTNRKTIAPIRNSIGTSGPKARFSAIHINGWTINIPSRPSKMIFLRSKNLDIHFCPIVEQVHRRAALCSTGVVADRTAKLGVDVEAEVLGYIVEVLDNITDRPDRQVLNRFTMVVQLVAHQGTSCCRRAESCRVCGSCRNGAGTQCGKSASAVNRYCSAYSATKTGYQARHL